MYNAVMKTLYDEAAVSERIAQMAQQIVKNYSPGTLFVSLLNGAAPFTSRLMAAIYQIDPDFHPNVQYIKVSRYGDSRQAGELKLTVDLPADYQKLSGIIILLDDLVDGGATLNFAKQRLLD